LAGARIPRIRILRHTPATIRSHQSGQYLSAPLSLSPFNSKYFLLAICWRRTTTTTQRTPTSGRRKKCRTLPRTIPLGKSMHMLEQLPGGERWVDVPLLTFATGSRVRNRWLMQILDQLIPLPHTILHEPSNQALSRMSTAMSLTSPVDQYGNKSGTSGYGSGQSDSGKSPLSMSLGFLKNLTEKKSTRGTSDLLHHTVPPADSPAVDGQTPKRRGPKPDSKPALTRRQELNRQAQR
jgi:hypothetical protein